MKHHPIPDPPPITERMTSGAVGYGFSFLVGRTVTATYEIPRQ